MGIERNEAELALALIPQPYRTRKCPGMRKFEKVGWVGADADRLAVDKLADSRPVFMESPLISATLTILNSNERRERE
jgi:hypothetical protein